MVSFWSLEEDARLIALLREGVGQGVISEKLGRCRRSVRRRVARLGLKDMVASARIKAAMAPDFAPPRGSDAEYTFLCLRAGGFTWWSERELGRDRLNRRKMAVCLPLRRLAA